MTIRKYRYALLGKNLDLVENIIIDLDENNQIIEIQELNHEVRDYSLLIPSLFNAHVHSADIGLRGVERKTLAELVGPGGIKAKYLSSLDMNNLGVEIAKSILEARIHGVQGWSDFREGGIMGIEPYSLIDPHFRAFARVNSEDISSLPRHIHIGLRDVIQFSEQEMYKIAAMKQKKNKILQIHAAEDIELLNQWKLEYGSSDVIWAIRELGVDTIIHLTNIDEHDLDLLVRTDTAGVICYRSNLFTRAGIPPVTDLINSGIVLGLGTDNAMFHSLSLWEELKSVATLVPTGYERRLLSMATVEGAETAGLKWGVSEGSDRFLSISLPKGHYRAQDIYHYLVHNFELNRILK
ncbi:MAG: amidohydrolase family protein [Candidatus Heimdallarchaeota archaeon]|nr:amidohydrolase family protein [Candidatus Heimdallarchaeota archaeon]